MGSGQGQSVDPTGLRARKLGRWWGRALGAGPDPHPHPHPGPRPAGPQQVEVPLLCSPPGPSCPDPGLWSAGRGQGWRERELGGNSLGTAILESGPAPAARQLRDPEYVS